MTLYYRDVDVSIIVNNNVSIFSYFYAITEMERASNKFLYLVMGGCEDSSSHT